MTEAAGEARLARVLTPPIEAPDFRNFRPTRDDSGGIQRRLEAEELWAANKVDRAMADFGGTIPPRLMVENASRRLAQGVPAEYDIDRELSLAPAAEIEIPEDTIATEESLLGEASAEDRRGEVDEARQSAALIQDSILNPELLLDAADAADQD